MKRFFSTKQITKTGIIMMGFALLAGLLFPIRTSATSTDKETQDYKVNVALYTKECTDDWSWNSDDLTEWTEPQTEPIEITTDGEFSLKLTDLQIPGDKLCLCYLKDADVYAQKAKNSTLPKDVIITTEKLLVNDESVEIGDKVRTGLFDGVFDVAYHNDWRDLDNVVNFVNFSSIHSIEVIFSVKGLGGEFTTNIKETTKPTTTQAAVSKESTQKDKSSDIVYYATLLLLAFSAMCSMTIYSKKQKRK